MLIPHPSSGAADGTFAASEPINGAIHSAVLEPTPENRYDADSSSCSNGENPVK
jgi:hypothetical protein